MEIVLGLLVLLAAIGFVVVPLARRPAAPRTIAPPDLTPAEQRAAIYRELLDLELDHRLGKVDASDYQAVSEALLARGAALIDREDAEVAEVDARVEQEISAMRASLRETAPDAVTEQPR